MSAYNRRTSNSQRNSKIPNQNFNNATAPPTTIPGTPLQQMWTVLNFHEQRLTQVSQYLQQLEENPNHASKQEGPSETEHMIQYNTLLQQVSELTDRVAQLETEQKSSDGNMITLNIEEDLHNASVGQPTV
jgi:hypothetical protein